jgi:hypothetical protein
MEDRRSSSVWVEPIGEKGGEEAVSLAGFVRITKVESVFQPMMCRLLGNREERGPVCGRTGNESGTIVGQKSIRVGCCKVRLLESRRRARLKAEALRDLISSWVKRCGEARAPGFAMRFSARREWGIPILFRLGGSLGKADNRSCGQGVVVP